MKTTSGIQAWLRAPTFSPKGFLVWAAVITVAFVICRVAGLTEYTSVLCGTSPSGDTADRAMILLGLICVLAHFSFVLLVPILILGAGIFALFCKYSKP